MWRNPILVTHRQPRAEASLMKLPGPDIRLLQLTYLEKMSLNVCKFRLNSMGRYKKDLLGTEGRFSSQKRLMRTPTNPYSQIKNPVKLRRRFATRYRQKAPRSPSFG